MRRQKEMQVVREIARRADAEVKHADNTFNARHWRHSRTVQTEQISSLANASFHP